MKSLRISSPRSRTNGAPVPRNAFAPRPFAAPVRPQISGKTSRRPLHVWRAVDPGVPEPGAGTPRGVARSSGVVDPQKGRIVGLEGGPLPGSAHGAWREAEQKILALAETVEKKGHKLLFAAEIYSPSGFAITLIEIGKGQKPVSSGRILFNSKQPQDEEETGAKVSGKVFAPERDQTDAVVLSEDDAES